MVNFTGKVDEVFYEILETFGRQTYDEMLTFFQTKKEKDEVKRWFDEVKYYKYGSNIIFDDNSIYLRINKNPNINKNSVRKTLAFLRFLFTLRDENNRLQYFHTIEYADLEINFPDVMIAKINDVWVTLQYCRSKYIDNYNEAIKLKREQTENEKYPVNAILITDPDIDVNRIKVNNLMNIVTIDNDNKVVVLK